MKDSRESALDTRARSLSNADHLGVLHAIWQEETRAVQADRYRQIVLAELPPEYAADGLTSPQATWLWRTLRAAEVAGLDAAEVVRQAVGARSLSGARDVASVIDSRLRKLVDPLVPQSVRPWSERVPQVSDRERKRYLTDLAAAMDARKDRIGEHLVQYPPSWAVRTLGPVPDHPLDRLGWQRRAADVGAYRELYGYDHPAEPIEPEPTGDSPDKRAAWHAAFLALGPAGGVDQPRPRSANTSATSSFSRREWRPASSPPGSASSLKSVARPRSNSPNARACGSQPRAHVRV